MDNPKKPATQCTQDVKHSSICVGHQYRQTRQIT